MSTYEGDFQYSIQQMEEKKAFNREQDKLKLLACYQAGKDIIKIWNTIKKLSSDEKRKMFLGSFVENNDQIVAHLSFESLKEFNKRVSKKIKASNKLDLYIHSDRSIYIRTQSLTPHSNRPLIREIHTKSSDKIIDELIAWSGRVDPELDQKIKYAIKDNKERSQLKLMPSWEVNDRSFLRKEKLYRIKQRERALQLNIRYGLS
jgi:hypothetical protein